MPEIEPVPALRLSPGGRDPLRVVKVYGAMPPFTLMTALYELPTVAVGKVADIAIGSVAMEGVPEALSVEQAVVASTSDRRRTLLRKTVEKYRF
jgi:hypothetical protein